MDYLFFDIECADGHRICSFGYVLTDDRFNIKQKHDLLVNPRCPFRLGEYREGPSIELAYPKDEFYASPDFAARYSEIAELFGAEDRLFFGHSVASDITFLADACKRYNKKRLKFDAFDTQMLYAKHDPEHRIRSLEGIMIDFGIDTNGLAEHKSCDDAEMTMLAAERLCEELGCSLSALVEGNPDCVVNYKSIELMHIKSAVRKTVKACNKNYATCKKIPLEARRKIYISDTIAAKDAELRRELVRIAYRKGYAFSSDIEGADIVVTNGNLSAAEMMSLPSAVEKVTTEKLSALLGAKVNAKGEAVVSLKRYFAIHGTPEQTKRKPVAASLQSAKR